MTNATGAVNRRRRGYTTTGSTTAKSFHKNDETTIPRRRRHCHYDAPSNNALMPRTNNQYVAMLDPYSHSDNNNYKTQRSSVAMAHNKKMTTTHCQRGYTIGSTTVMPYSSSNNNNNINNVLASSTARTATACKDFDKGGATKEQYNTTHLTEFEPGEIVELDKENIGQQQEWMTKRNETIGTVSARTVLEAAEKEASKRNMSRAERSAYIAQELSRWKKEQKDNVKLEAMRVRNKVTRDNIVW